MGAKLLSSENFGLKIYDRFPPSYREDDVKEKFALKRYLQVLGDGGFKPVIEDINGLTLHVNPRTTQSVVLPYLAEQYGLEVFHGIPDDYLRFLIPLLSNVWEKKGSVEVLDSIVQVVSGVKSQSEVLYDSQDNPYIKVKLEMDYNFGNYFPDADKFNRLLRKFIPYYVDLGLVYDYMFYVSCRIQGIDEYLRDTVREKTVETASIPSTLGLTPVKLLNVGDKVLNDTLILNEMELRGNGVDPDIFKDVVVESFVEDFLIRATIDNLVDVPHRLPDNDFKSLKYAEKDAGKLKTYYPEDSKAVELTERSIDRVSVGIFSDVQGFKREPDMDSVSGFFTNTPFSLTNNAVTGSPECFDVVTFRGTTKIIYPTLQGVVGM